MSDSLTPVKVPAGATGLKVTIAGGTGDADLYMKLGAAPTQSVWDYRPYLSSNNETVSVPAAKTAGDWHIMVRGYKAYSGVSLDVTWN